jgi:hypothetical protein
MQCLFFGFYEGAQNVKKKKKRILIGGMVVHHCERLEKLAVL